MAQIEGITAAGQVRSIQVDDDGAIIVPTAAEIGAAVDAPTAAEIAAAMMPTSATALGDTITSATPDEESEFEFGATSKTVYVRNDGTAAVEISFDDGQTYLSLDVGQAISLDLAAASIWAKSASASQAFTALVGV